MEQTDLGKISESTKIDSLSRDELIQQNVLLQTELTFAIKEIYKLKNQNITDEQLKFILQEQLNDLQNSLYGTSSERYKYQDFVELPSNILCGVSSACRTLDFRISSRIFS